jgi:hemolysin activation/secretion protein
LWLATSIGVGAQPAAPPTSASASARPTFAELEAAGVRIGVVRINPRNIFDTDDPAEDRALFRLANRLHITSRAEVIERSVLFAPGQLVSAQRIEETERLLRTKRFLYDVQIRPIEVRDGVVDIEVLTRDTWTLQPGLSVGRAGGANDGAIRLREYNLLGTGVAVDVSRYSHVDRQETVVGLSGAGLLGRGIDLDISSARASDGRRHSVNVSRPFKALDTPWAAGLSLQGDDRIDTVYRAGQIESSFRHRERRAAVHGGWSTGLVDGWVRRHTVGVEFAEDAYAAETGLAAPPELPADQRLVIPFVRFELLQDRYERQINRDLIGKPEDIALGWNVQIQLGQASPPMGSSRSALRYNLSLQRGFTPAPRSLTLVTSQVSGEYSSSQAKRQRAQLSLRAYWTTGPRTWLYSAFAIDHLLRPDPAVALTLGGDNGLRGYPLRYQTGTRRALLTFEGRHDTGLYLWRLFRLGVAAYANVGRAWGGAQGKPGQPWMADVGVGLRIVNVRAAFGNVLHVDVATPVNGPAGVRRVQFVIETRTTF